MKIMTKTRSILVSLFIAFMLSIGTVSIASADEATTSVPESIEASADSLSTQAEQKKLVILDAIGNKPNNVAIHLNSGQFNLSVEDPTPGVTYTWTTDRPDILRVVNGSDGADGLKYNEATMILTGIGDSPLGYGRVAITVHGSDGSSSDPITYLVFPVDINTTGYKWTYPTSAVYTGKPITPDVTITGNMYTSDPKGVKQAYGNLVKGRDYDITYLNNTALGTATVTVTGKNGYTGTRTFMFKIERQVPSTSGGNSSSGNSSNTSGSSGSGSSNGSSNVNQSGIASGAGATTITTQAKPSAPTVTDTWKKSGGKWWFSYDSATKKAQNNKSWPKNEWVTIKGKRYHFNGSGYMNSGWFKSGSTWYYLGSDGAMKTGWQKVKGTWYYLASDGKMQTGKKLIANKIYYLNPSSGAMKTGWNKERSGWYYYTGSGVMKTGWQKVKSKWYYLDPANGRMKTGFYDVSGSRYYSNASGAMQTGWRQVSGKWYHFKGSGAMSKGWAKVKNKWYYLDPSSGTMKTGFYDVKGSRYYSNGSGAMQTGWKKISNKWYYFAQSGAMQKSKWIGGKYWVGSNGVMVTSSWVDNNKYYVGANGAWIKSAKR